MTWDPDFDAPEVFVPESVVPEYVDVPNEADPNGTIFGSLLPDGKHHIPIFDLDMDCRLVPSRTPGHFHLYVNKPLTRVEYAGLLVGLQQAGLVQEGWARRIHTDDKQTYLRLPADPSLLPDWAPKSRYKDPELEQKS